MIKVAVQSERAATMFDRHRLAHAALAVVYAATATILILEGMPARAVFALAAALIYAALSCF
jgi:hypothetical protein